MGLCRFFQPIAAKDRQPDTPTTAYFTMNRNRLNFLVDLLTGLLGLALAITGLLLYFVLPPGSGRGRLLLLGYDRHFWGDVHFYISIAVLVLVLVHVALHWQWVCTVIYRMVTPRGSPVPTVKQRRVAGLAAMLALIGFTVGLLWGAAQITERPGSRPAGQNATPTAQPTPKTGHQERQQRFRERFIETERPSTPEPP